MPLNVKGGRFVVRPDEHDPSFFCWAIEFDGEEYVVGTRSAPQEQVYEFIEWLRTHIGDLQVTPPPADPGATAEKRRVEEQSPAGGRPASGEEPGQSYG